MVLAQDCQAQSNKHADLSNYNENYMQLCYGDYFCYHHCCRNTRFLYAITMTIQQQYHPHVTIPRHPRRSPLGETAGLDCYLLKPTRPPAACRRPNPQIPNDSQVSLGPRGIYHCLMTHWIMGKTRFLILWISRHSPSLDRPSGAVKPTSKGKKNERIQRWPGRKPNHLQQDGMQPTCINCHPITNHILYLQLYIYMWSIYIWLYMYTI